MIGTLWCFHNNAIKGTQQSKEQTTDIICSNRDEFQNHDAQQRKRDPKNTF